MQSLKRTAYFSLFCTFFLSICLVGFGRPSDTPALSYIAAMMGCAILGRKLMHSFLPSKEKFLALFLFFAFSSLLQTRWLLSHPYSYIIAIWLFLSFFLSLPYAYLFFRLITKPFSWTALIQTSVLFAFFDLLETDLFFCGISFRSLGALFMADPLSSQLITLFGGMGLSFLFCFFNGAFLYVRSLSQGLFLLSLPIIIGGILFSTLPSRTTHPLRVALFHFNQEAPLSTTTDEVIKQYKNGWRKIFASLSLIQKESVDLVLLPEGVVPFSSQIALFQKDELPQALIPFLPPHTYMISSGEISQALSYFWKSPLLVGMERKSSSYADCYYNSCFLFSPDNSLTFYDKQVLVPGGEYIPFEEYMKPLLSQYGIVQSFEKGEGPLLLKTSHTSLFPLICYEETLSRYVLPAVRLKADLLVSISNDHWFPSPLFAKEHWLLGKMRAMETGLSLLRCSNMGKSGLILPTGREFYETTNDEKVLLFSFVPEKRTTLFAILQEQKTILFFFCLALIAWCMRKRLLKDIL